MTLDLRLNPASFRRHINTSTDVRTGRQVDVGYWLYDVVTKIQPISDVKQTSGACWDLSSRVARTLFVPFKVFFLKSFPIFIFEKTTLANIACL